MAYQHRDENGRRCGPVVENPSPHETTFPGVNEAPQGVPSRHQYWCDGCASSVRVADLIEDDGNEAGH